MIEFIKEIESEVMTSDTVGMFRIRTANEVIKDAAARPDPRKLWLSLWYEGELTCLFADSGAGKSIYAVQIATELAKTFKVLYIDFELSDKQFQMRYTDDTSKELYHFPDNFFRAEESQYSDKTGDYEDRLINDMETAITEIDAKVVIFDNLTYACSQAEKGDIAAQLMMRLIDIKRKYGISMLVISHTPKRDQSRPITQNDLAGSKKLYNFFDAVFAIGKSAKDPYLRYIKQLKIRSGEQEYGADNVIVATLEKQGAFLGFKSMGFAKEREHLEEPSKKESEQMEQDIRQLSAEGKSLREIAAQLGISKSKVGRILKG